MSSVIQLSLALALSQATDPHVIESFKVDMTEPLSGPDFLLISKAAQHPKVKGRDLSCYRISIMTRKGIRTVSFLGVREEPLPPKEGEIVLGLRKQNPRCPDRHFEMDDNGRIVRMFYSRH